MTNTQIVFVLVGVLIPSVILHEVAHGWVADRLGDDTARVAGRLSLNPIRHIDPFGTVLLPVMMAIFAPIVLGYAKPVPVVTSRLRNPRRDALLVSLAGPAMNGALALGAIVVFRVFRPAEESVLWYVLALFSVVNVVLGLFNLLPFPPLDGAAIIEFVLPDRARRQWHRVRPYAPIILLVVLLRYRGILDPIFEWAVDLWRAQQ